MPQKHHDPMNAAEEIINGQVPEYVLVTTIFLLITSSLTTI